MRGAVREPLGFPGTAGISSAGSVGAGKHLPGGEEARGERIPHSGSAGERPKRAEGRSLPAPCGKYGSSGGHRQTQRGRSPALVLRVPTGRRSSSDTSPPGGKLRSGDPRP